MCLVVMSIDETLRRIVAKELFKSNGQLQSYANSK